MSKQAQPSNSRAAANEQNSIGVIDAEAPNEAQMREDREAIKKDQKRHLADYDQ